MRVRTTAFRSRQEQILDAAVKVAQANHYLVALRMPENATYEDCLAVCRTLESKHACGRISYNCMLRATGAIAEASGYSLTDLNC